LNEKTFVEAAQALALRVMKESGPDNHARVRYAFRLCTGREPDKVESEKLLKVNLHKAAAWAMVSRTLLNLDETITRE
jgi:hypothetical protein